MANSWDLFKVDGSRSLSRNFMNYGVGSSYRPDRTRLSVTTERSLVASLYSKIAIDVSAVPIKHVRTNQNGIYQETIDSDLNKCLSISANIDQTGREFILDCVLSMFDEGCVAIVPVETNVNILTNDTFKVYALRTGKVKEWFPRDVKVEVYNDITGRLEEVVLPKEKVCLVENPFFAVMNETNATLKRLAKKLSYLDNIDAENASSKLNMLLQFPYAIKTPAMKQKANDRLASLEDQLQNSSYGIAYVDSTEKIVQLNRSLDNGLLTQVEDLTKNLYNQLGITQSVFDGSADEKTMLNYYNSTIEPVLSAITDEMTRKFLTKTSITQRQRIMFIRNPFRLVPVNELADIADKFTRNEIMSSNEMRAIVGYQPVDDDRANELRNKNLNQSNEEVQPVTVEEDNQTEVFEDQVYE